MRFQLLELFSIGAAAFQELAERDRPHRTQLKTLGRRQCHSESMPWW
jgi:hypothetical protein